jgi:hypothetical protein
MIGWPSSGRCLHSSTQVDRDTRSVDTPTTTLPEATCGRHAAQSAEENAALHQNQTRSVQLPSRTGSGCGKEQSPDRVSCVCSTYLQAPGSPTRCTLASPTLRRASYHGRDRGPSSTPGETMETTDSTRTSCVAGAAACLSSTPCLSAHAPAGLSRCGGCGLPTDVARRAIGVTACITWRRAALLQRGWTPMEGAAGWMLRFVDAEAMDML